MEFSENIKNIYLELSTEVVLFPSGTAKKFPTIQKFYDYMLIEQEYWQECTINNSVASISNLFSSIVNSITAATNDENSVTRHLSEAIRLASLNTFPAVYSKTTFGKLILSKYRLSPVVADGLCRYLNRETIAGINFNVFKGFLEGVIIGDLENFYQDTTDKEKETLSTLKSELLNEINLNYEVHKNHKITLDDSFKSFKDETTSWSTEITTKTEILLKEKQDEFDTLESRYNENLMLKEPAAYWEKLHIDYNNKGDFWRERVIWSSSIFVVLLSIMLFFLPDIQLTTAGKFNLQSLKETLIFAIIVSIGFYVIKLFVTLTMSSYHLSRDAKERQQLTYVYLALLKEKGVEPAERSIILNSIFARSDTGLLKGDSGPSFPDVSSLLKAK